MGAELDRSILFLGKIRELNPEGFGKLILEFRCKVIILNTVLLGGMVVITKEEVKLVPTTFEWAETIDVKRAEASENRAKAMLEDKNVSKTEMKLAEARLKRALVRKSVAGLK